MQQAKHPTNSAGAVLDASCLVLVVVVVVVVVVACVFVYSFFSVVEVVVVVPVFVRAGVDVCQRGTTLAGRPSEHVLQYNRHVFATTHNARAPPYAPFANTVRVGKRIGDRPEADR